MKPSFILTDSDLTSGGYSKSGFTPKSPPIRRSRETGPEGVTGWVADVHTPSHSNELLFLDLRALRDLRGE